MQFEIDMIGKVSKKQGTRYTARNAEGEANFPRSEKCNSCS